MPVGEVFAGIPVRDRDAAIRLYERLLGAPPTMLPNDEEAAWQLTGGGWLCVLPDAGRAGRAVVTLLVDDLDERLAASCRARHPARPGGDEGGHPARHLDHRSRRQRVQSGQPG